MIDSAKLITLARWFDNYDKSSIGGVTGTEVQEDLRRIAQELQSKDKRIAELEYLLCQTEAVQDKTALILKSQTITELKKQVSYLTALNEAGEKVIEHTKWWVETSQENNITIAYPDGNIFKLLEAYNLLKNKK